MNRRVKEKYEGEKRLYRNSDIREGNGTITVYTLLNSLNGDKIEGMKINLYEINGISPNLKMSKYSDKDGKVKFENIKDGNYRIIEIVDKSKYLKPAYITWNEVNINSSLKEETIYVINRLKNKIIN